MLLSVVSSARAQQQEASGAHPYAGLIMDTNGNLYGTTLQGGANGEGTVFELVKSAGTYSEKVLHSFGGSNDGYQPCAGLIMDANGDLYGTTYGGGAYSEGTVFELVKSSATPPTYREKILYSFGGGGDANNPYAGLIMDTNGNLYGTTYYGGVYGCGTVFKLKKSSGTYTEKILHSFGSNSSGHCGESSDGYNPYAGLIMDTNGNLYGTTYEGGASDYGAVFELKAPKSSSGTYSEKILHSFGSSSDGYNPYAGLIMDTNGNLYGTTYEGGANGYGTVFELANSSGTYSEKILYSFGGSTDGANPYAGLVRGANGNLYGTTYYGGSSNRGTVFELKAPKSSSGTYSEKILHSFASSSSDGYNPYAGLIMDTNGNLYGTTYYGGLSDLGAVFELVKSSGKETVLVNFK
jgi:uncharacterized repeat protein (TIGR03803 family)